MIGNAMSVGVTVAERVDTGFTYLICGPRNRFRSHLHISLDEAH
jgi:hypothetical protein